MNHTINIAKRSDCTRAFTLTELLIVVALVAVLAALTFTGLGSLRERSVHTKAASNLRQIGVALVVYAGEHNRFLPFGTQPDVVPSGQTVGSIPYWWAPAAIAEGLAKYLNATEGQGQQSLWSDVMQHPGDPNANIYKNYYGFSSSYIYRQSDIAAGGGNGSPIRLGQYSNRRGEETRPRWLVASRWGSFSLPGRVLPHDTRPEFNSHKFNPSGHIDQFSVSSPWYKTPGVHVLYEDGSVLWRSYPNETLGLY